jgi:cold shock CspA family protein
LRKAELEYDRGEYVTALNDLQTLVEKYDVLERDCLDIRIVETVAKSLPTLQRLSSQLSQSDQRTSVLKLIEDVRAILEADSPDVSFNDDQQVQRRSSDSARDSVEDGEVYSGRIELLVSERKYGFIAIADGCEVFFHQSGLAAGQSFDRLIPGQEVRFVAKRQDLMERSRAVDIVVVSHQKEREKPSNQEGMVKSYGHNGQSFGFITSSVGDEYFFHKKGIARGFSESDVAFGTNVTFDLSTNDKGVIASNVRPRLSVADHSGLEELARTDQYVFGVLEKTPTHQIDGAVAISERGVVNVRAKDFRRKSSIIAARKGSMVKFRVGREAEKFFAFDVEIL